MMESFKHFLATTAIGLHVGQIGRMKLWKEHDLNMIPKAACLHQVTYAHIFVAKDNDSIDSIGFLPASTGLSADVLVEVRTQRLDDLSQSTARQQTLDIFGPTKTAKNLSDF